MSSLDSWVDIARTGVWTDMHGRRVDLDAAQLARIAEDYRTADPAPLVVGHPVDDSPAWGWVSSLRVVGDRLQARFRDLAPAFREAVEAGRSISFKDDRLRHVGFLGGATLAIAAGRRRAGRPIGEADCQIAAISCSRGAVLVTRNMRDFEDTGADVIDPWSVAPT